MKVGNRSAPDLEAATQALRSAAAAAQANPEKLKSAVTAFARAAQANPAGARALARSLLQKAGVPKPPTGRVVGRVKIAKAADGAKPARAADKAGKTHTVKSGDTLWAIAQKNGLSLQKLIAANPQIENPDLIFPGQKVKV